MIDRRKFIQAAGALGVTAASGRTLAQSAWPSKPVKVITPFPAGGGTDAFLRPITARLSQTMGQQFTVATDASNQAPHDRLRSEMIKKRD